MNNVHGDLAKVPNVKSPRERQQILGFEKEIPFVADTSLDAFRFRPRRGGMMNFAFNPSRLLATSQGPLPQSFARRALETRPPVSRGAQKPHKSPSEATLRDAAFWAIRDHIFCRKVEAAQMYPAIRHKQFQRLREKEPGLFSLSILLHYADALECRQRVLKAIHEASGNQYRRSE